MQDHNSKILLYASHVAYPINFLAKAAAAGGYEVYVVVPEKIGYENGDHSTLYAELKRDPNIQVIDPCKRLSMRFSHAFVLLTLLHFYSREEYSHMQEWLKQANSIGAIGHFWPSEATALIKQELNYLRRYPQLSLRIKTFGHEEKARGNGALFWRRRYLIGGGPHPRYFHDAGICSLLYSQWDPTAPRLFKMNFLGTRVPESRQELLSTIEMYFKKTEVVLIDDYEQITDRKPRIFWRAEDRQSTRPRPHDEYLHCLTDSDFTICLPGYTRWSCRPHEAWLRGSVPIMDEAELDFTDVDGLDGQNCILVKNGQWLGAIERALAIGDSDLTLMRANILSTRKSFLELGPWSKRLRSKMGI